LSPPSNPPSQAREFFIHGVAADGRPFRPSDWAERLAGVLACYRPGGASSSRHGPIGYSPYVRPVVIGGTRCVVVDERLREVELLAFEFALNFARDNGLPVTEACSLPEPEEAGPPDSEPAGRTDHSVVVVNRSAVI
jgi:Protein of unknown function (DUF3579)